ncbi:Indole-3-acetic acid-amido synthetase GH3.17 [Holothuria leucospilota]|uniref:Indole-3-acetic acid-amido synthetase GH3.17 n=1 Tax=Holothuria leucospilota TaxID=206669 RepID=A0A9Q1BXF4_HOLLE|nr:Indole-3-acetic acid-amido synthetase GH3.17 [Holothuria leucospilota]
MKYVVTSAGFFMLSAALIYYAVNQISYDTGLSTICLILLLAFLTILSGFIGFVYLFISTQPVSQFCSVPGAFVHFFIEYTVIWQGKRLKAKLESSFKQPRETQEAALMKILCSNQGTSYYRDFGLSRVKSLVDLKEKQGLTEYDHYVTYVDRIAKGEIDVMVKGMPERLVLTSGTTGKGKLLPCKRISDRSTTHRCVANANLRECFPNWQPMRSKIFLYCRPTVRKSQAGIDIASIGYIGHSKMRMMINFTTPWIGFKINTLFEAIYVHLLFGLRDRNVGWFMSIFTTMILEAMQLLEKEWPRILRDLSTGSIDKDLKLSPEVRIGLTEYLGGGWPERAGELETEFRQGFDGIMRRIWPHMAFISAIDILNLRANLQKTYCKGIPIFTHTFGGSEAIYGANWDPLATSVEFVMFIEDHVFEFIPEEDIMQKNPKTFFLDEVEVDQNYELVITQDSGLYRYRVGDVVRVTGFKEKCPKIKFLYRTGTLLNMCGEKVSSDIVRSAVRDAVSATHPDVKLMFHTVAESSLLVGVQMQGLPESESQGAHYIFFLEVEMQDKTSVPTIDKASVAKTIDANLYERHTFYRNFKDTKQIQQSSVYIVYPGSFYKLKDYVIANTTATEIQCKMPDKVRTLEMFKILFTNRV